jgi:hypothetical protein
MFDIGLDALKNITDLPVAYYTYVKGKFLIKSINNNNLVI